VRDYLLTEVVAGQPANAQTWLRKLSVPERFNAALCEHLCAEEANEELGFDGHTFLRGLQRAGLFLIALDRSGEWYRYHALFRGLLRRQLERSEGPEGVAALDRRASAWFAESGLVDEAIQHALAAGDQATAAGLVEQNRYKVLQNGRWHDLERWLNRLPRELIDARPELLMANAWVRRSHYDHAAIPPLVAAVETTRGTRKPSPIIEGELQFFKGHTEYYKVEDTRSPALLEQARASTLRNFAAAHGIVEVHHAMAVQKAGHKQRAVRQLRTALQASDSPPVTTSLNLRIGLALVHLIELDLAESLREAARIRAIAHDAVDARLEGWGFYLTASVHFLRNELHEAPQLLESNIGRPFALYQRLALDSFAVRALCFQGCGDVERARQTHALMEAFATESGNPTFVTVAAACEARLALAQGDAARAERCLEHADVRNDGSLMLFWVESPRLTECRIRLARGTRAAGESVLRTLRDYERENRTAHNRLRLLDILVLQASAHCLSGRKDEAFDALREAVAIAERGGVVYPFVEAGPPIVALLRRLGRDAGDSRFISRLVAACDRRAAAEPREGGVLASRTMPAAALFGLTNREEEVLGLLVQRLEAKEIAARLFVAPSTVNFHLKNIYAKMRVGCRRDAIAKVRARGAGARSQVT
jgi:ATP/maltotriose-dependent transcriptional regulator MalT